MCFRYILLLLVCLLPASMFAQSINNGGVQTSFGSETVASSATPTFSLLYGTSYVVLTSNVTSFTLPAGLDGQSKTICWKQGSGPYTVAPPGNVSGFFVVGTTNAGLNCQTYKYSAANSIWQGGAGVVNSGGLSVGSDGVHAGIMSLVGNTTNPTIPVNQFAWLGFNSTSATAYGLQPSTTAPVTGQYMAVSTPSSGVSQVTYSTPPGSVVAVPTPLTAQAANLSFVTIYTSPAANHYYQVCGEANQTQAATTSSTMVQIQIGYTSAVDNVIKVANIGTSPGETGNSTVQDNSGCVVLFVKASTTIQWATVGYVSAGATPMQYSLSGTVQLVQ